MVGIKFKMKLLIIFVLFIVAQITTVTAGEIKDFDKRANAELLLSNSKRYYFSDFTTTWFEAAHFCHYGRMELVKIENAWKNILITKQMKAQGIEYVFTSGIKIGKSWKWGDGKALGYTNWGSNQPNNNGGDEHCLVLTAPNGKAEWHDYSCEKKFHFVCEGILSTL